MARGTGGRATAGDAGDRRIPPGAGVPLPRGAGGVQTRMDRSRSGGCRPPRRGGPQVPRASRHAGGGQPPRARHPTAFPKDSLRPRLTIELLDAVRELGQFDLVERLADEGMTLARAAGDRGLELRFELRRVYLKVMGDPEELPLARQHRRIRRDRRQGRGTRRHHDTGRGTAQDRTAARGHRKDPRGGEERRSSERVLRPGRHPVGRVGVRHVPDLLMAGTASRP